MKQTTIICDRCGAKDLSRYTCLRLMDSNGTKDRDYEICMACRNNLVNEWMKNG